MPGSKESGKKAATTMLKKYGKDYYKKLAILGGKSRDGRKHAEALKEKYGQTYFSDIAKKRKGVKIADIHRVDR